MQNQGILSIEMEMSIRKNKNEVKILIQFIGIHHDFEKQQRSSGNRHGI